MAQPNALDVIAALPPALSDSEVRLLLRQHYGIQGELSSLVSERDQNVRVSTNRGEQFVLKIANSAEPREVTEFQIDALLHIERSDVVQRGLINVPRIVRTTDGRSHISINADGGTCIVRLVTYLPGQVLGDADRSLAMCTDLGRYLANLGIALVDFRHQGENPSLLWDVKQTPALRQLVQYVSDPQLSEVVSAAIHDYEKIAMPMLDSLRWQVVHADCHPDNVLIDDADHGSIAAVIDFGDMSFSPLVFDVAVAAAYLRSDNDDWLREICAFLAGYQSVNPLPDEEIGLLHCLIRSRLAATVTIHYWRASAREPGDPYLEASKAGVAATEAFLIWLHQADPAQVTDRFRQAYR